MPGDLEVQPDAAGCPAGDLGQMLGFDRLLVGGQMDDTSFRDAQPDVRYHYATGGVPADGPPSTCDAPYRVLGESWWGCWGQAQQLPPGQWARRFLQDTAAAGAVPLVSYYQWYFVTGYSEGRPEIEALTDGELLRSYLRDYRFLCQTMGEADVRAILHIEPDLWGFARVHWATPTDIPVALSDAGIPECAGLPDTMTGLGCCLLAIARAQAPKVLVGFHATGWNALANRYPQFDVPADARATAEFLRALGADQGDLVVVEMSNCDAGSPSGWWYDAANQTLPHFTQAMTWAQQVSATLGLGHLWWQIPYGHMGLDDTPTQYRDNRLDYFFDHPEEFSRAGAVGMVFGTGCGNATSPSTDGGHFVERAQCYKQTGGVPLCAASP